MQTSAYCLLQAHTRLLKPRRSVLTLPTGAVGTEPPLRDQKARGAEVMVYMFHIFVFMEV